MRQAVRYLTTPDRVRLAWATTGDGPPLLKASNWLTHLEYDWDSPVWRHWTRFFANHFTYVRYDERGCGLTDRDVGDLSFWRWADDLTAVADAAGLTRAFPVLGISQGAAIACDFAVRHPERVSALILYGGYATGANKRNSDEWARLYGGMEELARYGWDNPNSTFRQVFTSRFIPGGDEEQIRWFNDLCRKTTSPDIAARLIGLRANVDIRHLLPKVRAPTLVLHAEDDEVVPFAEAKGLACGIPNARLVSLASRNHILLEHEPAWRHFRETVLDFMADAPAADEPGEALSRREQAILTLLADGRSNAQIGWELDICEKTVRNHITHVYAKLGVRNRAGAMARVWRNKTPA